MPLNKADLGVLKKQYPSEHYNIKEQNGSLSVTPKKTVIRIFTSQARKIKSGLYPGDTISEDLEYKLINSKLMPADFEQCQITVEKKVADKMTAEAKRCKTRKIIYLQKLLGGF